MAQEGEGDNSAAAAEEGAAARGRHSGQSSQDIAQPRQPRPDNVGKASTATLALVGLPLFCYIAK